MLWDGSEVVVGTDVGRLDAIHSIKVGANVSLRDGFRNAEGGFVRVVRFASWGVIPNELSIGARSGLRDGRPEYTLGLTDTFLLDRPADAVSELCASIAAATMSDSSPPLFCEPSSLRLR